MKEESRAVCKTVWKWYKVTVIDNKLSINNRYRNKSVSIVCSDNSYHEIQNHYYSNQKRSC